MKEQIEQIFKKYYNREIIIFTHADHDGICASFGLNYVFNGIDVVFSLAFRPVSLPNFYNKRLFIICDLLLSEKQILSLLEKGLEVINFDHHDIRKINHPKYLCLNPKLIFDKQFISSSGLMWKLFKPEKIAWILAVGSAGDIAVEDITDLFEFVGKNDPELMPGLTLNEIYHSKIFELAQILLMSFDEPQIGFDLLQRAVNFGYKILYNSDLYTKYLKKQNSLNTFLQHNKDKIVETEKYVLINSSNQEYPGSYSVKLNLNNTDDRMYIEYNNGRLSFRNYFGEYDVRNLAGFFGGGGSHARSCAAYTKKSFQEVFEITKVNYSYRGQKKLSSFS